MKYNVKDGTVEGTPEEMVSFIKSKTTEKKEENYVNKIAEAAKAVSTKNKKKSYKKKRKRIRRVWKLNWKELLPDAARLYHSGLNLTHSLKRILGRYPSNIEKQKLEDYLSKEKKSNMNTSHTRRDWNKLNELIALEVDKGKTINAAFKEIIGRSFGGQEKKLFEKYYAQRDKSKNQTDDKEEYIKKRMNYLTQYYKWDPVKAESFARIEWNSRKENSKDIPVIIDKPDMNKILIDMLDNVIKNKGVLKYIPDGSVFNIQRTKEWREFILEFWKNRSKICSYFEVQDKFKLINNEGTLSIVYE